MQHTPKKLVMTRREGGEIVCSIFAEKSTREDERLAMDFVKNEGWLMHAMRVGSTVYDAVERHLEVERDHHLVRAGLLDHKGPVLIRMQ